MFHWRLERLGINSYLKKFLVFALLLSFGAAACSPGRPAIPSPEEPAVMASQTAVETGSPTPTPSPSPTTEPLSERVLLLAAPESDPLQLSEVQSVLEELVAKEGLHLETIPSLTPEQITPDVRMVVSIPPDPGLEALADSARDTEFFAIEISGLGAKPNLTSASIQKGGADQQGFMAGVIAALVTPDWRIGAISLSDTPEGQQAREGFVNGAVYFCGTCRQIYPPFFDTQNQLIQYPLYVELPASASETEWQTAAGYLIERGVETVYVFPGAGGDGLLNYLAESGMKLIGGGAPPEGSQANWLASLNSDPSNSWQALLESALLGQEPQEISGELQIGHINAELFSPGRQKLAQAILEDLLAGYLEAGSIEESENEP